MPAPDVFITGVGIASPAGIGAEAAWRGLLAGGRYVRAEHRRDRQRAEATFPAAPILDFIPPPGTEQLDRVCQLAIAAAEEAVGMAFPAGGLGSPDAGDANGPSDVKLDRVMVSVGTSKGGILSLAHLTPLLTDCRHPATSGGLEAQTIGVGLLSSIPPDAPARCIADRFGITGGVHATVAACSTGTLAIIRGARFIEDGQADLVLCGSADASLHELWFAAFTRMGVLASADATLGPSYACRPFDRTRRGFVLGEGAGMLVVESGQSARRRGVRPIARLAGAASGTDPAGLAQVSPDGEPLAQVIRLACGRAGYGPDNIACIHAHGTGTGPNDRAESRAIQSVFGFRAESIPTISIKGAIGHLLGAAGSVETAAAALACRDGVSPGTATLIEPDPNLGPLNLPRASLRLAGGSVLKTSSGFGGHVVAVVLAPI